MVRHREAGGTRRTGEATLPVQLPQVTTLVRKPQGSSHQLWDMRSVAAVCKSVDDGQLSAQAGLLARTAFIEQVNAPEVVV